MTVMSVLPGGCDPSPIAGLILAAVRCIGIRVAADQASKTIRRRDIGGMLGERAASILAVAFVIPAL